ncbi:hypothetical protein [Chryseobacterium hagamense]|uniref:Uncharacterized protein n=1 Tax=Chryseobacterium hagamense TaxID=395935 RepID=A0A511YQ56_9FLAO|nr:hypothetical protein [Chryseobacterium hagamense]GEN77330.1 hypothetical protein CHA01nite_30700 [Chryseobacterium hagamense]
MIIKHLNYSKKVKESHIDFKNLSENYKKITGLSSLKKQMNNSKCVQIYQDNHTVTFTSTKNGGTKGDDKGYSEITDKKIIVEKNKKDLYRYLFQCFDNCE